ncbi:3-oxoadipate enol-lactonase [Jannaschia pohangensis]|uniref:3-oxoadipate enol-lactonase n=1 Tax=Jannaschia pohangensis TaxID=390807 RepID=A0A1I3NBU6_9RHOB|nr:3-oxoadipate enol-lactonase [Jannaschia pohangensis]SFJ06645.1 3-oxoadipate enol-lactonase [Jannaschia pohangensis]
MHVREDGDPSGLPVVFANSLGSDLRLWDGVLPHLPDGLRLIRWDKRGHGASDVPPGPYSMGTLVSDAETILDDLGIKACIFVGVSIGGMIAQGLAVKRPDLIDRLVLSNTAARIGARAMWQERIDAVRTSGMASIADAVLARWFGRDFQATGDMALWRGRFCEVPPEGYAGCCAAIAGADFYTPTSSLRLPTLAIAGSEDTSTPPDLMRETADLIPGAEFALMRRAGHLPCVEQPREFAALLTRFVQGGPDAET